MHHCRVYARWWKHRKIVKILSLQFLLRAAQLNILVHPRHQQEERRKGNTKGVNWVQQLLYHATREQESEKAGPEGLQLRWHFFQILFKRGCVTFTSLWVKLLGQQARICWSILTHSWIKLYLTRGPLKSGSNIWAIRIMSKNFLREGQAYTPSQRDPPGLVLSRWRRKTLRYTKVYWTRRPFYLLGSFFLLHRLINLFRSGIRLSPFTKHLVKWNGSSAVIIAHNTVDFFSSVTARELSSASHVTLDRPEIKERPLFSFHFQLFPASLA